MFIVIIGCGRLGSTLASELADEGHMVSIVDRDGEKLRSLGSGFNGQRITGIEFDHDKLLEAGIQEADALLAVTNDDNVNLTVSLIAKDIHKVPKILARVNAPGKTFVYDLLSIETINPVQSGIEVLKRKLMTDHFEVLTSVDEAYDIIELLVNRDVHTTVEEIEETCHCRIGGITHSTLFSLPERHEPISLGDRIICTVSQSQKNKLFQRLCKEMLL